MHEKMANINRVSREKWSCSLILAAVPLLVLEMGANRSIECKTDIKFLKYISLNFNIFCCIIIYYDV